jgi:hypothetical protein
MSDDHPKIYRENPDGSLERVVGRDGRYVDETFTRRLRHYSSQWLLRNNEAISYVFAFIVVALLGLLLRLIGLTP